MGNIYLEKIAADADPVTGKPKKGSTLVHALSIEGGAIATGLAMKAVGSRFGGGKFGNALANSKVGRMASKAFWGQKNVGGRVLTGELGEYGGSIAAVYGGLKLKDHNDAKKANNAYLQKAASFITSH